jgi:hypothetical protein
MQINKSLLLQILTAQRLRLAHYIGGQMAERKKMRKIRNYIANLISAGTGLALWIVIPAFTGDPDVWGSSVYFTVGIPLLMVECSLLGYLIPDCWWQYGLTATLPQAIFLIIKWPTENLLPLGLIFLFFLSILYLVGGFIGVLFRKKFDKGIHRRRRTS